MRSRLLSLVYFYSYSYAIGGQDYIGGWRAISHVHRITKTGASWETRANYPFEVQAHCAAADEGFDRIYILGGKDYSNRKRSEVYYYTVSSNTWSHHSNLMWTGQNGVACSVVTQKDGARWLLAVSGDYYGRVMYWDITTNSGWYHASTLYGDYKQRQMSMVNLSPTTTLLLGGYTQRNNRNLRNVWKYNVDKKNFYDTMHYMRGEHDGGRFTRAKKNLRALTNCAAERTYAAVGWGGHTTSGSVYPAEWSVLLRKRRLEGDPRKPVRCDNAIPNLSPGRYLPGYNVPDNRHYH